MKRKVALILLSLVLAVGSAYPLAGCAPKDTLRLPGPVDTMELSFVGDDTEPVRLVGPVWGSDLLTYLAASRPGRKQAPPGLGGGSRPGEGESGGARPIRFLITAHAQEPGEFVITPDRLWAQGRVWTGDGLAAAYNLCLAPLTLRAEFAQCVLKGVRLVVDAAVPRGTNAEMGLEALHQLSEFIANASLTSDGPVACPVARWPRPEIRVSDFAGSLVLTIRCLEHGVSEVRRPGVMVWMTEAPGRPTVWDWAVGALPPISLDPTRPEVLMLATEVTVTTPDGQTQRYESPRALEFGALLSDGEDLGPRQAPEGALLTLTFSGVDRDRETVLVFADGFWWAGKWYALPDAEETATQLLSVP